MKDKVPSLINVLFEGVYGYEFNNDSMVIVIFEFEEIPLEELFNEYGAEIRESYRRNGAYGSWVHNIDNTDGELGKEGVKSYSSFVFNRLGRLGSAEAIGGRSPTSAVFRLWRMPLEHTPLQWSADLRR
ncbi:MAG: hypothetical protein KZQ91_01225 [Candidatus Thiodiazotropha sp. (ex Lucinoma borealis)]|nr:hypothetical protein [Candidatus Thiodiazotropha sp. (ex Lucinoma borealis)]